MSVIDSRYISPLTGHIYQTQEYGISTKIQPRIHTNGNHSNKCKKNVNLGVKTLPSQTKVN